MLFKHWYCFLPLSHFMLSCSSLRYFLSHKIKLEHTKIQINNFSGQLFLSITFSWIMLSWTIQSPKTKIILLRKLMMLCVPWNVNLWLPKYIIFTSFSMKMIIIYFGCLIINWSFEQPFGHNVVGKILLHLLSMDFLSILFHIYVITKISTRCIRNLGH
jgi:hypothetical protein